MHPIFAPPMPPKRLARERVKVHTVTGVIYNADRERAINAFNDGHLVPVDGGVRLNPRQISHFRDE